MASLEPQIYDDDDVQPRRGEDDVSDADSDLEELESDIAKLDESVRQFLASHRGTGPTSSQSQHPSTRGGPRGRGARGPRKAAKPRGDITARLSKVNQAFLSGDYARALDLVSEVIRINAETHQAWTTLASIFGEMGEVSKSLSAMVYAAHLRPKDVAGWMRCASYALDTIDVDEAGNLHLARLSYSAALRADPSLIDARLGKATVCHQQGHLSAAITEYSNVLKQRPQDLELVRRLAEACMDNRNSDTAVPLAIAAYRRYFDHERAIASWDVLGTLWYDIGIYVELLASIGHHHEAIGQLKALSRWLVGRLAEECWETWEGDDCEWDATHDRRSLVPGFTGAGYDLSQYGPALPHDLRARLAIYRLRLGDGSEALEHLSWLDPLEHQSRDFVADFPFLAFDIATELHKDGRDILAARYLEILREISGEIDPAILLLLGRCYLACDERPAAEECFLGAIEADENSIEPRIELANMYESMHEDEAALILAAEAMALRGIGNRAGDSSFHDEHVPRQRPPQSNARTPKRPPARPSTGYGASKRDKDPNKPAIPRRYRPKKLAAPDKLREDEQAHAVKLSLQYQAVRDLKQRISNGEEQLIPVWMQSSKDLVDDFRSLKKFYTWDKYLHFLGTSLQAEPGQSGNELSRMYERLARTVAPQVGQSDRGREISLINSHQGISFDEWLELFLDYAIGLAIEHRREEAYQVCEAAKDSTVFQSPEHNFAIYTAWSVCAIYTSDEQRAVATARQLMKDGGMSDSYRMFALLSALCQSPISWYTSGPSQKYILRQIKATDSEYMAAAPTGGDTDAINLPKLDVCLLMLYGHILFTSTSYTYALGYFLRAKALDPQNSMVNLSLGLAYVHYGLKRQSANRQYLILQGQAFMYAYLAESCNSMDGLSPAEAYYNVGRLFHLLGITSLALEYYTEAESIGRSNDNNRDVVTMSVANHVLSLLTLGNKPAALSLLKENLIL